ncbi:MAG: branched-chain amino acid ABC transporter permease [Actinomycetia bacterium]|nr:branched-chain amino acid ABC transporter permease [Actinomycetes bacterium]
MIFLVLVAAFAILLPNMFSEYTTSVGLLALFFVCLGLGLNVVVGYAGLLDLGFAAFYAIGAYATGLLALKAHMSILETIPLGVGCSIIGAFLVGYPTLRLRSDYLAIVTLGFGEIIQAVAQNLSITGGPTGLYGIPPLSLFGHQFITPKDYYYVMLVVAVLYILFSRRIRRSPLGLAWLTMREDEDVAASVGIPISRYKVYAYIVGGIMGSIAGSLYAPAYTAIAPASFGFQQSLLILLAVAIGGIGSIPGTVVGGIIVAALPELLRSFSQARLLIFGIALALLMIFRRQGLWPAHTAQSGQLLRRMQATLRRRRVGEQS